ncbi:glycosyltransferase family 4 protein [Micromonospora sp. CPCC 206061]|uniref:glycosyltransferase family 4 protein n=1 Tax=Micromonospora sp. CPCC 206061 TaxID=3122410 RepID=UPI002FF3773E
MISRLAGKAKHTMESYRLQRELRRRQPPTLLTGPASGKPTIYYLGPDLDLPIGGIRVIYRHVDTLRQLGIEAAVLHGADGFRSTWFENKTRIEYASRTRIGPEDLLVVPEWYGPTLDRIPRDIRVVIFNQRAYDTWDFVPYDDSAQGAPYAGHDNIRAILTVSQDNADLLGYAFAHLPVYLTRNAIDPTLFHPGDQPPARRISFTTTRRAREREQLLRVLHARDALLGWEVVPIENRTERETAEIMRESAIFLSFSDREGFGLPPAEAMASGCYVVGYHGLAGREFFDPEFCTPVEDGDLVAFARAITDACAAYDADPEAFSKIGRAGSERVLARYSAGGLTEDLQAFYTAMSARPR